MTAAPGPVVLLVEDDPDDVFFLQEAFKAADWEGSLRVARDGEEALARLNGESLPDLMLLDLKLPRVSGLEVLERCRKDARLRTIPIVVLTSSQSNEDIARAYALGANSYLVKPIDAAEQKAMVKALIAYWLGLNKVPEAPAAR